MTPNMRPAAASSLSQCFRPVSSGWISDMVGGLLAGDETGGPSPLLIMLIRLPDVPIAEQGSWPRKWRHGVTRGRGIEGLDVQGERGGAAGAKCGGLT